MAIASKTTDLSSGPSGRSNEIGRRYDLLESVVLTADASGPEIDFTQVSGGMIILPNGCSATEFTFHVGEKLGGTYEALYDTNNVAVTMTVAADRAYPFPDECFGAHFIRIEISAGGAATPNVDITLKG